jgi:hypothetical protein
MGYGFLEKMKSFVDTPLEDVVPKALLVRSKGHGYCDKCVKDWAWKWWLKPYLLNDKYESDETWALLRLYQNGKIHRLPSMSLVYLEYWMGTPVWMHGIMKQI